MRSPKRVVPSRHPYVREWPQDTEFPGVVARPIGTFRSTTDYQYQTLRCNVDLLKIIQLGLTFSDSEGKLPDGDATWQFHFKFNLKCAPSSPTMRMSTRQAGSSVYC